MATNNRNNCGKHYREGKILGDIKLLTNRKFLIPKENERT